jgi:hypothetical protein
MSAIDSLRALEEADARREYESPANRWLRLRDHFLAEVKHIDAATEWVTVEPAWWLEMMRARDAIRELSK